MQDYRKVSPLMWTRGSGKRLRGDRDAQVVGLYLVTAPNSTMTGLYHVAIETMAAHVGMEIDELRAALVRLEEEGFAFFDEEAELAWVPNMLRIEIGDVGIGGEPTPGALKPKDKKRKGIEKQVRVLGNHRFASAFWDLYAEPYQLARPEQEAPSKGLPGDDPPLGRGTLKEQEQEQEQEQERESGARAREGPPASLGRLIDRADAALRTAVLAEHRRVYGPHEEPATSGQRGHRAEVARWIVLRLERREAFDEIEPLAEKLVRNFYARQDPFIRAQVHDLKFLAENPPKYLAEPVKIRSVRRGSSAALPPGTGEGFDDGGLEFELGPPGEAANG